MLEIIAPRPICLLKCHCRVVYMLQSCPMDDAVRLLNPILSAEIWVGNNFKQIKPCVQKKWLMSVFELCPVAPRYVWTPSDLLPSHESTPVSCPSCWCWHSGGTAANPQKQNSVSSRFIVIYFCLIRQSSFTGCTVYYVNALSFPIFSLQILPEVPHLRLSTGGAEHPVHSAVVPQQSQRRLSERPVEEPQSWAAGNLWPKTNKPDNKWCSLFHQSALCAFRPCGWWQTFVWSIKCTTLSCGTACCRSCRASTWWAGTHPNRLCGNKDTNLTHEKSWPISVYIQSLF